MRLRNRPNGQVPPARPCVIVCLMSRVVRVLLPWLAVLAFGYLCLGLFVPNTLALSLDPNFITGFARSLFIRNTGSIRVPDGFGVAVIATEAS